MKILMVNKFHYRRGGSETYYFALADAMVQRGHQVIYFSMTDHKNEPCEQATYFVPNVEYEGKHSVFAQLKNGLKLIYSFVSKRRLEDLILQEKPDVAHLNLVHRHLSLSIVDVLHKYGIPIVFTMHDLICLCPCYTMLSHNVLCERCSKGNYFPCVLQRCVKNSVPKSLMAALEGYFLRMYGSYNKVDLYISPSEFLRKKLEEGMFTEKPIIYRRNFLPTHTVYELCDQADDYLLYFGRLSEEKGIITLLRAMIAVAADTRLLIAGDGPQLAVIEEFIAENDLNSRVRLLGFQGRESMAELVSRAKGVIIPSEWYENCPYSVMESMAKGKPVIGARIGGLPELINDGVTGFLFEPCNTEALAQAIDRLLLLSEEEYSAMSEAALSFAKENFDAEKYVLDVEDMYMQLVDKTVHARK